jgi:hypothetical protein
VLVTQQLLLDFLVLVHSSDHIVVIQFVRGPDAARRSAGSYNRQTQ